MTEISAGATVKITNPGSHKMLIAGTGPQGPQGAPGGSDASFAAWVNDDTSQTHAALTGAYVSHVSTPTGAAIQSAIDAGARVVVLAQGVEFTTSTPLTWNQSQGPLTILAYGATVTYTGTGHLFDVDASGSGSANVAPFRVFGGTWQGTTATAGFYGKDLRGCRWEDSRLYFPVGSGVYLLNVNFWSERNQLVNVDDRGCAEVLTLDKGTATSSSFARTIVRDMWLQNGTAGRSKINIKAGAGPYGSVFSGLRGNTTDGVGVMTLNGSMGGTIIADIDVETPGTGATSYVFEVGTLSGAKPELRGAVITRNMYLWKNNTTPSGQVWAQTPFPGVSVTNAASNWGVDIAGRKSAPAASPANPVLYVGGGGGTYPFNRFGDLLVQGGSGRGVFVVDGAGSVVAGFDAGKVGFYDKATAPVAKAADPGTATGTDAVVINNIVAALRNLGLVT